MLCRVHRPRIDIQVGIDLDSSNPVATVLQDTPDRCCGDPFSNPLITPPVTMMYFTLNSPIALHFAHNTY